MNKLALSIIIASFAFATGCASAPKIAPGAVASVVTTEQDPAPVIVKTAPQRLVKHNSGEETCRWFINSTGETFNSKTEAQAAAEAKNISGEDIGERCFGHRRRLVNLSQLGQISTLRQ